MSLFAPTTRDTSMRGRAWNRFRHDKVAMAGLVFFTLVVIVAILSSHWTPYPPDQQNLLQINATPTFSHLLGTDDLGRDILSRLMVGARISLESAVEIVGLAVLVSTPIALVSGYFGGWIDHAIMRITDAFFAFPPLLFALAVAALLGPSLIHASVAIAVVFIPSFIRLTRGQVLSIRVTPYVDASLVAGAGPVRIMRTHVLRNVASPLIVQAAISMGFALLAEAGLSFLGISVQPPTPSWGNMLQEAFAFVLTAPWQLFAPGLAIMLTVLAINVVGDGLRDALGVGDD
jgi:peptide/nickel transport system permease protein